VEEQIKQSPAEIVIQAQGEIVSHSEESSLSLDDIVSDLKGFGIEDLEEIITIKMKSGKTAKLRVSNIPSNDEMASLLAVEGQKGYLWVKAVKIEILSRAISWVNGRSLRTLTQEQRLVVDPTAVDEETGKPITVTRDIQVVLRNLLKGWGEELVEILWKILMTHSQTIEDRLKASLPESALMTEVESRLFEQARAQIDAATDQIIQESVAKLYDPELDGPLPAVEEKK
jgi:hypothetical protein